MYNGYLEVGGNEIVNSARTFGYTHTAECHIGWLMCGPCEGLRDALDEAQYDVSSITSAPWYDPLDEATTRFYGVHALSMENLSDSTRTATVEEGITDGGVVGYVRHAVRQVRVRAILSAHGEDALEAGLSWLDAALAPETCSSHGNSCGSTDACFFVACPPERVDFPTESAYQEEVSRLARHLHGVTCISGPIVEQKLVRGEAYGYIVEFILAASTPWVFSETREVDLATTETSVIEDVPFNLIPTPSAEYTDPIYTQVARNLSLNPSLETNVTGWSGAAATLTGTSPAAYFTNGRVTGEPAANGTASYRARILGNSGTGTVTNSTARMTIQQTVAFSTDPWYTAGRTRFSINIWGAIFISAGASGSSIQSLFATIDWLNGSAAVVGTTALGSAPSGNYGGYPFILSGMLPPSTAVSALVRVSANVTWSSSASGSNNSDIRMYADALAFTIP